MSRVLQAVDSIHQVGIYCLALVPPNHLPKTPLGGIHLSETRKKFLEGSLHPANVLMCPHTCVTNLPKPREVHHGNGSDVWVCLHGFLSCLFLMLVLVITLPVFVFKYLYWFWLVFYAVPIYFCIFICFIAILWISPVVFVNFVFHDFYDIFSQFLWRVLLILSGFVVDLVFSQLVCVFNLVLLMIF